MSGPAGRPPGRRQPATRRGQWRLSQKAISELKNAIRQEQKDRREKWQGWLALLIGFVGALIGLLSEDRRRVAPGIPGDRGHEEIRRQCHERARQDADLRRLCRRPVKVGVLRSIQAGADARGATRFAACACGPAGTGRQRDLHLPAPALDTTLDSCPNRVAGVGQRLATGRQDWVLPFALLLSGTLQPTVGLSAPIAYPRCGQGRIDERR